MPWKGASATLRLRRGFTNRPWTLLVNEREVGRLKAPSINQPWSELALDELTSTVVVSLGWRPNWQYALDIFVDGVSVSSGRTVAQVRAAEPVPPDRFERGPGSLAILAEPANVLKVGAFFAIILLPDVLQDPRLGTIAIMLAWVGIGLGYARGTGLLARWLITKRPWSPVKRGAFFLGLTLCGPLVLVDLFVQIAR